MSSPTAYTCRPQAVWLSTKPTMIASKMTNSTPTVIRNGPRVIGVPIAFKMGGMSALATLAPPV